MSPGQLKSHPLVQMLQGVKTKDQVLSLDRTETLLPKPQPVDLSSFGGNQADVDLIEFQQSLYTEAFGSKQTPVSTLKSMQLRLCAFIDLKSTKKANIPFRQQFACRYVSLLFTDYVDETHLYP
jgi:hypothetical protein